MAKTWMKPANLKAPLKVIVLDFGEKKGTVTVACGRFPTYSCGSHSQGATMARSELKTSPKSVDYWIASRTRYIVGFTVIDGSSEKVPAAYWHPSLGSD